MSICDKFYDKVGSGTYSTVYETPDPMTVIKFNYKEKQLLGLGNLKEFDILLKTRDHPFFVHLVEIRFLKKLSTENIPRKYHPHEDCDTIDRIHFGLDRAECDLEKLINTKRISIQLKYDFAFQLGLAIKYLHDFGILHSDIKPGNILYYPAEKRIALADFGMCQYISPKDPPKGTVYTIIYRAPEVEFLHDYSFPADIYAYGCVLFQLFTSNFPIRYNHNKSYGENLVNSFPDKYTQPDVELFYISSKDYQDSLEEISESTETKTPQFECCRKLKVLTELCMDPIPTSRPDILTILNSSEFSEQRKKYSKVCDISPTRSRRFLTFNFSREITTWLIDFFNRLLSRKSKDYNIRMAYHAYSMICHSCNILEDDLTMSELENITYASMGVSMKILSRHDSYPLDENVFRDIDFFENFSHEEKLVSNYLDYEIYVYTLYERIPDHRSDEYFKELLWKWMKLKEPRTETIDKIYERIK